MTEFFLAVKDGEESAGVTYRPAIFGSARLHFVHAKAGLDVWRTHASLAPLGNEGEVDWSEAGSWDAEPPPLGKEPLEGAAFAGLPGAAARKASYEAWKKSFTANLYQERSITILRCASLKALSEPGESERDFRVRLAQAAREARDAELDKLRKRYAPKVTALEERKRRAEDKLARERAEYQRQSVDTALSVGTTILGALLGRKVATVGNLGRARTAARSAGRAVKERSDIAGAEAEIEEIDGRIGELSAELEGAMRKIQGAIDPATLALETIEVRPRKDDITVGALALAWCPWRQGASAMLEPVY